MVNFKLKWILGQWKLLNRLAYPRASPHQKFNISKKIIFATKNFFFFKKRQWGMKYASSIVWKKLTVTVVKLISSLSWSYCQKEHSYFNTLLMHYYDFFGWLFFRNVGCFVLEKYRFLKYWILKIFSITFTKSSDANLLCDFHWP